MDEDMQRRTRKHFEEINFNEMSERWVDEAISYEFTDVEENPMSISVLFADNPIQVLLNLSGVCELWMKKGSSDDLEEFDTEDMSSRREDILWTYLDDEIEIKVKDIQGVVFFLCNKAVKTTSTLEEKEIGLLSAKWYFNCLLVPGSSAYSVYHPSLFRVCIDCFQVPDHIGSKEAKYKWMDFEEIMATFSLALESLVPLLSVFHLGTETTTVDYVIQKLTDLVAVETSKGHLNFDLDFLAMSTKERRRYSRSHVITCLAYQGFTALMNSELNGDREYIYSVVLSRLIRHILCSRVKKNPTIPAKFHAIKENVVAFLCHNLEGKDELVSSLTMTFIKRLCFMVYDKADFRHSVSHSVFTIMFRLRVQDVAELIKWLLVLVDAADAHHRVFAIEMLGLLLTDTPEVDCEGLPESMEVYLQPVPAIFAILTRCDDGSPNVRTRALAVISQHMTRVLNVLAERQEPAIFPPEVFENEVDCRGDHRAFWYNLTSFEETLKEIASIFHRHIKDNNGTARRAALQALESVITHDLSYLTKDNLKLFSVAAKDPNIVMRKQTVQSLTSILAKYPDSVLSQECWLRCIMPLVQDPENTVQAKVLGAIEEKFLLDVFADENVRQEAAFLLLRKISSGQFLSHQRYLQKAFGLWKSENKLKPQMVNKLERCLRHGNDEMIWFYLSFFAAFSKIPPKMCQFVLEEFEKPLNWENYSFMENILKVAKYAFCHMHPEDLENVRSVLVQKLEQFAASVEILPLMIETLSKIEKHLGRENEFITYAARMMKSSMGMLSPIVAVNRKENASSEDLAIKSCTVIKELCHIFPQHITPNLKTLFEKLVYKTTGVEASASNIQVTRILQAHAYAALGRISLQDEELARKLLPVMATELRTSDEDRIRNNIVVVLIEMVKRYTSFADRYISLIITCFKDKCYVVRHQCITLLVGLLQEDYIKCKGPLLQCILSTILDEKEAIRELGRFCLLHLLLPKQKSIFSDNFEDTMFILNGYAAPERQMTQMMVKQLKGCIIPFDANREKRMKIYKFMLAHMDLSSRALIIKFLSRELLACVHGQLYELDETVESIVKDCFAIFCSMEIRAYDGGAVATEVEEDDEERVVTAEINARREALIKPILPDIELLHKFVYASKRTSLIPHIYNFLFELLHDYKSEINDLIKDKYLLSQMNLCFINESGDFLSRKKTKKKARESVIPTQCEIVDILNQQQGNHSSSGPATNGHTSSGPATNGHTSSGPTTNGHTFPGPATDRRSKRSWRDVEKATENSEDSEEEMEVDVASSRRKIPNLNDPLLSSTPRVVIKPLSQADIFNNVSRIVDDSD